MPIPLASILSLILTTLLLTLRTVYAQNPNLNCTDLRPIDTYLDYSTVRTNLTYKSDGTPLNGTDIVTYGLSIQWGAQPMAFILDPTESGAYVPYTNRNCSPILNKRRNCPATGHSTIPTLTDSAYNAIREVLTGGLYDSTLSKGFTNITGLENVSNLVPGTTETGTDLLFLKYGVQFANHSFSFSSSPDVKQNQGFLGLSNNSTLLNALIEQKYITARSWGFWTGLLNNSVDAPLAATEPGSLILGGYEATRVAGNFTAFKIPDSPSPSPSAPDCPFPIKVKEMKWLGMDLLAMSQQEEFTACVTTASKRFELPSPLWDYLSNRLYRVLEWPVVFTELAAAQGLLNNSNVPNLGINTIVSDKPPGFTIDSSWLDTLAAKLGTSYLDFTAVIDGINITIPYSQLFEPQHTITKDGTIRNGVFNYNYDMQSVIAASPTGVNPTWGLPFLSGAYLLVDWENSTFNLAQASFDTNIPLANKLYIGSKPLGCSVSQTENTNGGGGGDNGGSGGGGKSGGGIKPQNWVLYALPPFVGSVCLALVGYCLYVKYRNGTWSLKKLTLPKFLRRREKFYGIEKDGMEIVESGGMEVQTLARVVHHRDPEMVFELAGVIPHYEVSGESLVSRPVSSGSGTGTTVESGTGTTVESGTGTTVESGTGTTVESGTETTVESGTGTTVESGTETTIGSGTEASGGSRTETSGE
ncbi:hypothetical protein TWF694_005830 [Orbilia ellipsospora]|uniref:Peptidase A1 domain-containing protein n=1 Tax=Orbilia ellipsospora TaxID=2528407 RepID=A0AAV9WS85_9PEZI